MSEKATYTPPPSYERPANNVTGAEQPVRAVHAPVELSSGAEIQTLSPQGTGVTQSDVARQVPQALTPGPQVSPLEPQVSGVSIAQQPSQPQQDRGIAGPTPATEMQNLPQQQNANSAEANGIRHAPEPWNPDPRMYPPQPYGQPQQPPPNQYPNAFPLHALQRTSQVVDCPICHQREMTRVEAVNGNSTHGWAAVLCCCVCLGCIPYMMAAFKDMEHSCGKCGHLLATYHGSGHVEVHQQQRKQDPK
ncbi:LITAF-like zinc ribbon domain-containing protein [Aspergillus unguis]